MPRHHVYYRGIALAPPSLSAPFQTPNMFSPANPYIHAGSQASRLAHARTDVQLSPKKPYLHTFRVLGAHRHPKSEVLVLLLPACGKRWVGRMGASLVAWMSAYFLAWAGVAGVRWDEIWIFGYLGFWGVPVGICMYVWLE